MHFLTGIFQKACNTKDKKLSISNSICKINTKLNKVIFLFCIQKKWCSRVDSIIKIMLRTLPFFPFYHVQGEKMQSPFPILRPEQLCPRLDTGHYKDYAVQQPKIPYAWTDDSISILWWDISLFLSLMYLKILTLNNTLMTITTIRYYGMSCYMNQNFIKQF